MLTKVKVFNIGDTTEEITTYEIDEQYVRDDIMDSFDISLTAVSCIKDPKIRTNIIINMVQEKARQYLIDHGAVVVETRSELLPEVEILNLTKDAENKIR